MFNPPPRLHGIAAARGDEVADQSRVFKVAFCQKNNYRVRVTPINPSSGGQQCAMKDPAVVIRSAQLSQAQNLKPVSSKERGGKAALMRGF